MARKILVFVLFLLPAVAFSTHIRGGQIRVVSTNGLTVNFEIRFLTNLGSEIKFGEGLFNFGDGSTETTPTIDNKTTGIPQVGFISYKTSHTYAMPGNYLVSYMEPNLNGGILNMFNSVETRFYIESLIVLAPDYSYSSPDFPTDPIFVCPLGPQYAFSSAAIDTTVNDFYYKYSLVTPMKEKNQVVGNYRLPDDMTINADNGLITWGTKFEGKYTAGMFWICVKVEKWSKGRGFLGYVLRATQIIAEDSDSKIAITSSVTDSNERVIVTDSQQKKIKVILSDKSDVSKLDFDIYFNKSIKNNVTMNEYDSTSGNLKFRVAVIDLKTTTDILADVPYPITLRGTASYRSDITFLYLTKNPPAPEPEPEPVVTGIEDVNEISVYPNPFRHELHVDVAISTEVTLINSAGQVVQKLTVQKGEAINTTGVASGLYFLKTPGRVYKLVRD